MLGSRSRLLVCLLLIAALAARELGGRSFEELGARNDLFRCGGGDEPLRHPVEEANAEVALQSCNPSADRTLVDTQARACRRAAAPTKSSKEYAEVVPSLHLAIVARLQR